MLNVSKAGGRQATLSGRVRAELPCGSTEAFGVTASASHWTLTAFPLPPMSPDRLKSLLMLNVRAPWPEQIQELVTGAFLRGHY